MKTRTLTVGIGFLITLIATLGMTDPDGITSTQDQTAEIQTSKIEYIHKTMEVDGQKYNWTIIIPPSATKGEAGILFLHGIGSSGDDGIDHIDHGLPRAIEENPESWPFVVIVPQKPTYSDWDFHESAVMKILDKAIEEGFVDTDKVAITGLSQGGRATMLFASMYPDRFVAAAPICGYAQIAFDEDGEETPLPTISEYQALMGNLAKKLKDTPVWLFHGEIDSAVPVQSTRAIYQILKSMDADVKYTEFPGINHNSWDPAYAKTELAEWFTEHTQD